MGNIQGELREEDSNNPSSNTTGKDSTTEEYNKGHIVIPCTQGLERVSKRYVGSMASRHTSRVTEPLRIYWSSLKTNIL